jgi:hypothetical protein
MKWRRETNYHNSRTYPDEGARLVVISPRPTIAWMLDVMRQRLARLLKPARQRPEPIVFKPGESRGFTVLGSAVVPPLSESAITCHFSGMDKGVARSDQ